MMQKVLLAVLLLMITVALAFTGEEFPATDSPTTGVREILVEMKLVQIIMIKTNSPDIFATKTQSGIWFTQISQFAVTNSLYYCGESARCKGGHVADYPKITESELVVYTNIVTILKAGELEISRIETNLPPFRKFNTKTVVDITFRTNTVETVEDILPCK